MGEPEDMYNRFRKAVENVNVIIATYNDELMGDIQVAPEKGTVAFGSGLHGWGFNVERFAKIYAAKMGADKEKMMKRLWGDSYFNAKKKTWTNVAQPEGSDKPLARAFCQFIMTPINQLMRAIMDDQKDKYCKMMETLGIVLKGDDRNLLGKPLMKRSMQIWINAADTLLNMIVSKLPSPRAAQKYRVENLYEGPMDDAAANAIRACDPAGGLMMYVSKMVPTSDKGRFHAFGRVFSGTIATGQKVRIQGPHYKPGAKEDLNVKNIQRTILMMGRNVEQIADVPCGNIVALVGVDQYILKSGTITTIEDAHNIACMKYSVSPVVKVAVKPKDGKDLPKLVEGLKKLSKSDPLVVCTTEESGEHVNSAWQWITKEGPLCEENMRAVRMNLMDVTLHTDSIHRGAGQIAPPMRRCSFAALMTGKPTLQEPVFLVEITCPQEAMSGVYSCMNLRRGCVFEENEREGTPLRQVKAYLPVAESFGFVSALRQQTSGQAFPQCVFDHWDNMPGDAMVEGKVQDLVLANRKRKNLKVEMPKLADYLDKL